MASAKDNLLDWLRDAHALEQQAETMLKTTASRLENYPTFKARIEAHVEETREQAFNVAIPTGGSFEHTFARDGFYRVGCDIHPAMAASIFSAATPFATLAEADGRFTFSDVPAGAWKVTVYAAGRRLQRDVDVQGAVTEVTVE